MKLRNIALCALVSILAVPAFAANLGKAGKWQTTIETEMAGMPMKMPAHTVTTCVTKEQVENAENLIPKSGDKRGKCTYKDVKVEGSTVSWSMACDNGMTGSGKIAYNGDEYAGSMQMKMQDHDISAKYTGKYLGACDGTETK
jgi:hypothetical protein